MLNSFVWMHIQSLGCNFFSFFFNKTRRRCITLDVVMCDTFIYVTLEKIVYFPISDQILPETCRIKRLNGRLELK